jgi:hypothetical protein
LEPLAPARIPFTMSWLVIEMTRWAQWRRVPWFGL